jgi:hypothetical protein
MNDKKRKPLLGDESGLIRDCAVACVCGLALFVLVIAGIYAAGYRLAGLPF